MNARVAVVIPTWNRSDLLRECLLSLAGQSFQDFDTVVVDDASSDDTVQMLETTFPAVRLFRLPENRGFCAAVNTALRQLRHPLIVLLNNDMTLDSAFLEHLVHAAETSDAALFAPRVLWRDDPELLYGAGDRQLVNGRPESIGFRRLAKEFRYPEEIFGVSAGAALYRREVFDRVGLLDQRFIAYFEDSDLNFRARLAGFRARFVPEAIAYHVGSASQGGRTWWRTRQCFRNHVLLVVKNMPLRLLIRHFRPLALEHVRGIGRVLSSARAEFGLVKAVGVLIAAWLDLVLLLPHALVERRRIQRNRQLTPDELEALLSRNVSES